MTLATDVRTSWQRFLDAFEPHRPELYRYCRHLTRTPWDAEDLAQDALVRAFATLGTMFGELPNPRAWLFRVASNLWIDRVRRARLELALEAAPPRDDAVDPRATREAAGTLLAQASPQERAALLLKDVFEFSLEDIAAMLATTVGAVKAALHRGRGKLAARDAADVQAPVPAVLDAFCAAFNARDLTALTQLLLEGAHVEIVGVVTEYGRGDPSDREHGSLAGMTSPITTDHRGGVRADLVADYAGGLARAEVVLYRGAPILLCWYDHVGGPAVRGIMTFETEGHAIARVRNYFFSPDVIAEVCTELGLPHRVNGYSYWL